MSFSIPTLELTFCSVTGTPWEGLAAVRFQGEPGPTIAVREHLTEKQRADLRWYIEEYSYSVLDRLQQDRAHRIEESLEAYGRALWEGIQGPTVQAWLGAVQILHAQQVQQAGRLELRAQTPADELAFRSPWELMRVGMQGNRGTLLHQLGVTVVRRPMADLPNLGFADTSSGLRVLAIVCRPDDAGFLDPRYSPQAILEALDGRPEVSVDFCRPGTLLALTRQLEQAREKGRPYHVVHFDGHGTTIQQEGGIGALCFEQADGAIDLVRAPKFGDVMARFQVPLMVLEACRTSMTVSAQETVAGGLLRRGVGTVVGMGLSVHMDLTRTLMAGFYGALARGRTLGEALQAARNEVYASPRRRLDLGPDGATLELHDWFVPQLYQGGQDPALLSREPVKRKGPKPVEPLWVGFPPAPRAGFQGRAMALHRLERALWNHSVVVLHAPGGMGKTALAREAAHWWTRAGFFEGAVFVSLEQSPSPQAIVAKVGEALEGEKFRRRKDGERWLDGQLEKRRLLLVWDNFESVLPAFQGGTPLDPKFASLVGRWTGKDSRVLITSRDGKVGLDAWPMALPELSLTEGLHLVVQMLEKLGIDRRERERRHWTSEALEPVVERAGGHALALELVVPHLPRLGPEKVASELAESLADCTQEHGEERNRSMAASLEFSIRHLSEGASEALPSVALLAGGCLEGLAPGVVGVDLMAWVTLRKELERLGLVRVEGRTLRPHPVLAEVKPLAAGPEDMKRYFSVMRDFCAEFDETVRSERAKAAMDAMAASEGVVRRAVVIMVDGGNQSQAWEMADSLKLFLERSGRAAEGAALINALHARIDTGGELTPVSAALAGQAIMARAADDPAEAVRALERMLERLEEVKGWDTRSQRAQLLRDIGVVQYDFNQQPALALGPLRRAKELLLELEAAGKAPTNNRATVLGDLANALNALDRLDEALAAAEEGLDLNRKLGDWPAVARALMGKANILRSDRRDQEAWACYLDAMQTAQDGGDEEALGGSWYNFGVLAAELGRLDDAAGLLRKAFDAFQRSEDRSGQLFILNALGNIESERGDYETALGWYEQAFERATRMGDHLEQARVRMGRASVREKQASKAQDPATRRLLLADAISEDRKALIVWEQFGPPRFIARSYYNLALHLLGADQPNEAQEQAQRALAIFERLRAAPDVWQTLWVLEEVSRALGDLDATEDYRRRKEAARA